MPDPIHEHGVKRRTCLFDLPYWKVRVSYAVLYHNMTIQSDVVMRGM